MAVCLEGWFPHWLVCDCMAVDHAFEERMRQKAATTNHGVNEEEQGKNGEDTGTTTATTTNAETMPSPQGTRRAGRRGNQDAPQG